MQRNHRTIRIIAGTTLIIMATIFSTITIAAPLSDDQAKIYKSKSTSLGMGLSGIADWSSQLPFINLMKQSRNWKDWRTKAEDAPPISVDENDWVTSLLPGQTAGTVFLVSPHGRSPIYSTYIVSYEGSGELEYRWSTKLVEEQSRLNRHVIEVGPGANLIEITKTDPNNPIRNISIVPEKHFQLFLSGEIFNPDWVNLVKQFNTLRYMDWLETNNSKLSTWQSRPKPSHRTWATSGVPLEIIANLANDTNTNLWINIPHRADKTYISNSAKLLKQLTLPHLNIYVEHSNEVWNWQFEQAHYANLEGKKVFGDIGPAFMRWHGMRTAEICESFKFDAFKDAPEKVHCVLGVQTGWLSLAKEALNCELKQDNHIPCYKRGIDHIGITTYFYGKLQGPRSIKDSPKHYEAIVDWANSPTGIDKAFEQLTSGEPLSNIDKKLENYKGAADTLSKQFNRWQKLAKQYNLTVVAYEGGQHIAAINKELRNNPQVENFYEKINDDPRMGKLYIELLHLWKTSGGGLSVHYSDISVPSKFGNWGARKHLDQSTPKWESLVNFNNNTNCWWRDCELDSLQLKSWSHK